MKLDSYGSPEMALLMAASGGDAAAPSVRRLMAGPVNWSELTRLAVASHATPGVWEVVSKFPDLPRESGALQSYAVLNEFRRYHIRALTARVVRDLASEGIEVLALKGAALLAGAVARPALRTMSDIDLLVTKGSPEAAWKICRAHGWTLLNKSWDEELYRRHHHLAPLLDPDGVNIGLELHRSLLSGIQRLDINVDEILARSRTVQVDSVSVRVPAVEDLLLHVCVHFAWSNKLTRGAWRAYADAHTIVQDPQFSWPRFRALVNGRRARQSCYWTLRLGQTMADLEIPPEVMQHLDPSSGGRLASLLERHFVLQIADPTAERFVSERVRRSLWFAAMHESLVSGEAQALWTEGHVDVDVGMTPRPVRGSVRAAIETAGYFLRLARRR